MPDKVNNFDVIPQNLLGALQCGHLSTGLISPVTSSAISRVQLQQISRICQLCKETTLTELTLTDVIHTPRNVA